MISDDEKIKRLKKKLELYGSYTREYESLEHEYFKYQEEIRFNDMPLNSAHNLGVKGDAYHSPVDTMIINKCSFTDEMEDVLRERTYLGLDEFIGSLTLNDVNLIHCIYTNNLSQSRAGVKMGLSRRSVQRRMGKIYKSWRTCPLEKVL